LPILSALLPQRIARIGLVLALPAFGVIAALSAVPQDEPPLLGVTQAQAISLAPVALPPAETLIREERFQSSDTPASLLSRLGVRAEDVRRLQRDARTPLTALRPGMTVGAEVTLDGVLRHLRFYPKADTHTQIRLTEEAIDISTTPSAQEMRLSMKSGTIRSSLFAATDAAGLPDAVAIQLAEVFGGDIDFHRDLRRNDRFAVVYETHLLDGRPVRSGRVLAAEFVNAGKSYRAVWFQTADGRGGYYTPEGKNLRKAFLRSPLEFSRISSGFGLRMHPIMQQWRAHRGIDYAAPTGTRVRAVADGVVDFAARHEGYGNMVVIRHSGEYSTAYAHLSSFATGLRKGARISQGDTIGAVGQTGWATGPHLHYEFRIAGEARNPLALALPAALPIAANERAAFVAAASPVLAQLDLLANTNLAALE